MITSFATVRTMMSICDIFMKTLCGGIMTNYIPKNRGMGFVLCLCNTKAKLAIKRKEALCRKIKNRRVKMFMIGIISFREILQKDEY